MMMPTEHHATEFPDSGLDGAYALLACEYDRADHRTTRVLETLGAQGFTRGMRAALQGRTVNAVLELGAGTGALTTALLSAWPNAHICATDVSAEMLQILESKLDPAVAERVTLAVADAHECARLCAEPPDLIAAGLADPYLDAPALMALHGACGNATRLFVSVPSRTWARRERLERLRVSIDTTRFRTHDGRIILAPSSTYDEKDLRVLLADAGFTVIALGTERSEALWSRPEVCWAIAAPAWSRDASERALHSSKILSGG